MTSLPTYYNPLILSLLTMPIDGYQYLQIPVSGMYNIIVAGAAGATSYTSGGSGAIISANVSLTNSDKLIIVCGNKGNTLGGGTGGGGGGQSAVFKLLNGVGIPIPLIVAGGGGGGAGFPGTGIGQNASSYLYNETTPSGLLDPNVYEGTGSATQVSASDIYPTSSSGLISSSGTILSGIGSIDITGCEGGFGGGGSGANGAGGAGSGWLGGKSLYSYDWPGDYGRNMILSTLSNRLYVGLNTGGGYVTITRLS